MTKKPIKAMKRINTVGQLIKGIRNGYQNPHALNHYDGEKWQPLSTEELLKEVKYLTLFLNQRNVKKGDMVGILSQPSTHWSIADLAILCCGGVCVPLFSNISEDNFIFETNQTHLNTIFVGGFNEWSRIKQHREQFHTAICLDDKECDISGISYNKALEIGKEIDQVQPQLFEKLIDSLQPDDLATIIYTSGSTGIPKGAMHTHASITALLHDDLLQWNTAKDRYLSILPLPHVFARCMNFCMLYWGISIYYYNDLKNLGFAFQSVRPTIFSAVPRVLEKVYNKMVMKIANMSGIIKTVIKWAFDLAHQNDTNKPIQRFFANLILYRSLKKALGGEMRVLISGGAPLNPYLYQFYINIGVPVYEGYGQTEACPISINPYKKIKIGTVGTALKSYEVKTDSEGELLVRGAPLMKGYYNNPEITARTIDKEGWLHTGDKASIDEKGYITIAGRIQELFKSSTGEMIAPIPIEQALAKIPFVDVAMIIARNHKFVSCLLVPDFEVLQMLKIQHKQERLSDIDFLQTSYIKQEMEKHLERINRHLSHWEQIRAYRFIPDHLSVETGELTPSMKPRREVLEKKYKELIDSIYPEEVHV